MLYLSDNEKMGIINDLRKKFNEDPYDTHYKMAFAIVERVERKKAREITARVLSPEKHALFWDVVKSNTRKSIKKIGFSNNFKKLNTNCC